MALFSTRSSKRDEDQAPTKNVPIDSIETLRTRARQRLIGAVVLVALGIVAFTLLFDSQPRPIPVDIQITMPDKDKPDSTTTATIAAPATPATPAAPAAPAAPVTTTTAPQVVAPATPSVAAAAAASASLSSKEEFVAPKAEKKPEAKVEAKVEPKAEPKTETKVVSKPEVKPAPKPPANDEAAKAMAILEGKAPPKAEAKTESASAADASAGRFVVQVGAFAENDKAQQVRLKVERAGMKTYTNVAQTKEGARTRVRVGPFTTRAEAEKAAAKIKTLDLPAAILTL